MLMEKPPFHSDPLSEQLAKDSLLADIASYWNEHIHDLEIATTPVGSQAFFSELDEYRYDKLRYLPDIIDFNSYRNVKLLEIGCGVGLDLVRFAQAGAFVTGIDLSPVSIELARKNFEYQGFAADLFVMNGEAMTFPDNSFEIIYAHGVLQYTADARKMMAEIYRVLKPGGEAIIMLYNKYSWLNALSILMKVHLEHADAPVLKKYSIDEVRQLLEAFSEVRISLHRFPVHSRLHGGINGAIYNKLFVPAFNSLPKRMISTTGWHIMAFATK
jgi:ubiquinone/menaquinone biosynthesis C-methylase UbiE